MCPGGASHGQILPVDSGDETKRDRAPFDAQAQAQRAGGAGFEVATVGAETDHGRAVGPAAARPARVR